MWCSGTFASADSRRMVISCLLISSEKIAAGRWCFTDADRAMSRPSVELWVGMKLRPARNRWFSAATWMQRTGTLAIGRTSVMNRTRAR